MDTSVFQNPPHSYRVFPMQHHLPKNRALFMQALKDYGFGGVVTNVPFGNGFTQNPENISRFGEILSELEENKLSYWIYDEQGYPSGFGGGLVLKDHPELEAKGFYMRRRVAYEPRHISFQIDEETDKIIWAAKYPLHIERIDDGFPIYEKMEPVPFTDTFCQCDLKEREVFFVFCVKSAYEGSHCTHNVSSFSRYINVMEPAAVRRFIDLCFEPIHQALPDAYANSLGVFTDEPSLQVGYARHYESWPYALAPWKEGLFEDFYEEYGFDLRPFLPLLFEGGKEAWPIRVCFYELVGKLIAKAFSGQLQAWCQERGCHFSGHYLSEENMTSHVKDYGNYVTVLRAAGYPGIDVLDCLPQYYNYNTAKFAQMAVRKNQTNGMMVEICPFHHVDEFKKDPVGNMTAVMGLLYIGGVRKTNSYFSADYSAYAPEFQGMKGYLTQSDAVAFNEYVGRLGYMLDGLSNSCGVFIYYGIEDVQAKLRPEHSTLPRQKADEATYRLSKAVCDAGFDFYYADRDDLLEAAKTGKITGHEVDIILVPSLSVMHGDAVAALSALQQQGIPVLFLDETPSYALTGRTLTNAQNEFRASSLDEILNMLQKMPMSLQTVTDARLVKAKFLSENREIWFIQNLSEADAAVALNHAAYTSAEIWDPSTGSVSEEAMGHGIRIPALRGVFVVFHTI
jgi:hypothetical protein